MRGFLALMISDFNTVLQVSAISLLLLTLLLMLRYSRQGMHTWVGIGFTASIICYLIIDSEFVQRSSILFVIALTGAINIPVFFWLLSKAIFDDHFKATRLMAVWFMVQMIPHLCVLLRNIYQFPTIVQQVMYVIAQLVSIGFLLAGLYTAFKTRKGDLIDSRVRFRNIFTITTASLIGVTLIVEAAPIAAQAGEPLQALQRIAILLLTAYFLISNTELKPGFFFKEYPKPKPVIDEDPLLLEKLEKKLNDDKIFKKEGLTIGELSELMNEQEYRLRRLINGQLGFRNFSDFINQYRVMEAGKILSDPAQNRKTILEIAYELGYQSIGPFNKAFKELKGLTPTAFRKKQQNH